MESAQGIENNTIIGRCNRNAVIENGGNAYTRKNYRAPGENGGVTTICLNNDPSSDKNVKYRDPDPGEPGNGGF